MTRTVGILGLSGGFLAISPKLRTTLWDGFLTGIAYLDNHSPYSYAVLGMACLFLFLTYLRRTAKPR